MNYKSLILIALALCLCIAVPVSAMWNNGNWIAENATDGYRVVTDAKTGVDSKYKDVPALPEGRSPGDAMQGTLMGNVRCGYNTLTREVGVRNDANPDGKNGSFNFYPINPDGRFEITLIPGSFTLMLKDGNGGQPEHSHAKIVAGGISYPEVDLLGHAISSSAVEKPVCLREILKASYCGETIPAVTHIVNHAAVPEHFDNVGMGEGDYVKVFGCYVYVGHNHGKYDKIAAVPAWEETITDTPAVTGGCADDVTQKVKDVLSQGYTSFLFNNAENPGGIFDITTTTLLSEIPDPAYGIVKSVSITYNDCSGNEQHVSAEEYQVITLN